MPLYDLPLSGRTHADVGVTVNADYALIIDLMSDVSDLPVAVFYRCVGNNGALYDGAQVIITDGLSTRQRVLLNLPAGLLTHVSIQIAYDLGSIGEVRARISVGTRGGGNEAPSVLVDGYIGGGIGIQWPILQLAQLSSARGKYVELAGLTPAAGVEADIVPVGGQIFEIITVIGTLTTAAAVANRYVEFGINHSTFGLILGIGGTQFAQVAATTVGYRGVRDGVSPVVTVPARVTMAVGQHFVRLGSYLITNTLNLQAADQWTELYGVGYRTFEF